MRTREKVTDVQAKTQEVEDLEAKRFAGICEGGVADFVVLYGSGQWLLGFSIRELTEVKGPMFPSARSQGGSRNCEYSLKSPTR